MSSPPPIFDLLRSDDPRDLIHDAVQRLFQGEILGLPTETQYVAAAYLLSPAATRLANLSRALSQAPPVLAVKSAAEALDYLPRASPLGRKLLRRFWPGPVTLRFQPPAIGGLAQALPQEIAEALETPRSLGFRLAGHDVLLAILRLLPAPLILTAERPVEGSGDSVRKLADAAGETCSMLLDAGELRYTLPTSVVHVDDTSWSLHRESVVPARTLQRLAGNLYLFVCTGNTCRSPMAEALFRRLLSERQHCSDDELVDRGFMVSSAGVAAGVGQPASDESIEQMRLRGIDLRGHESQPLTAELLTQADRVFTMTRGHRELVVRQFPQLAERVELLARDGGDVVDPIGGGPEDYRRCAEQIESHLHRILDEFPSEG
jgi:protein-tyrosine phosphatase